MARVFLSYDREDEPRARAVAAALKRAGHSVWWDRQIKGGHEFSAEIEAELDAADKVVVLWSARAVKSAWVRDEAAVGRETGRLVPATLDGTPPPLGFRQLQTIDLSKTKRGGASPQLAALVDAIGATSVCTAPQPSTHSKGFAPPFGRPLLIGVSAVVIAAAAVAVFFFWPQRRAETTIAVAPAEGSALSHQVANDLELALANTSNVGSSSYQVIDAADHRAPDADLAISAGGTSAGGHEGRQLSLRSRDGDILWTASIEGPSSDKTTLARRVAVQAQRAVGCAAEALSYRREPLGTDILKTYVSACSNYDAAYGANLDESDEIKLLERVVAKAPHFEPAWAKLLMTEQDDLPSQDDDGRTLRRTMAMQVDHARKLGLDFGELYVAKAETFSPGDFVDIFRTCEEGLRRHPGNASLYTAMGNRELYVGRMVDALTASSEAVQLDPQSPATLQNLISTYAYSGNANAAYATLRKAEQLWPNAPALVDARYRLDIRYGDPKEAMSMMDEGIVEAGLRAEQEAFLTARMDPTPENIEQAVAEDRKINEEYPNFIAQIAQTLAQFGRKDDVLAILLNYNGDSYDRGMAAEVLFRPAMRDVWRDPRSMAAAAHMGLLHYWKATGKWPDFCTDPTLPYDCRKEAAKYRV